MIKRKYLIIGFLAFCLTAALLTGITISQLPNGVPADVLLEFDSGWIDITDKAGESFNVTHNLNSTDVIVDITGKTTLDGGAHQRHLGLTGHTPGWTRKYGGTQEDWAPSIVQTGDGGYALAGYTVSFGAGWADFWLVKTDSGGNVEWNQTYGGTLGEVARSVVQTDDGGYALAGYTWSFAAGEEDFWLVKTDADGNHLWNQTYGGTDTDRAESLVQTGDGGYAIAGYTVSFGAGWADFWLVKTDADGNHLWNQTYGGTGLDEAYSLVQTGDGGYALAGFRPGGFWLVKTYSDGNMEWNQTYGRPPSMEYGYSMVQTRDGGYAIAGSILTPGLAEDFWLVKTDSDGNMEWNQTYGRADAAYAYSLVQTGDGGYALAGYTVSIDPTEEDFWLVKTDPNGEMEWNQTYGTENILEEAYSVVQTSDLGYAIAGFTWPSGPSTMMDAWLVKTDWMGRVEPGVESGLAWVDSTPDSVILYRGATDPYWNYVRVRIMMPVPAEVVVDTRLLFTLSPNPARPGQLVTLSGTLTDVHDNPVYPARVGVRYSTDGGRTWIPLWILDTNADGEFSRVFTAPTPGEWMIQVRYPGSEDYNPSSDTETLVVRY